jgi:hypothetical protein
MRRSELSFINGCYEHRLRSTVTYEINDNLSLLGNDDGSLKSWILDLFDVFLVTQMYYLLINLLLI